MVDNHGRAKETAYQLRKKSAELKRDLENTLVGLAQAAVTGSNAVARKMAGVQAQINAGVTTAVGGVLTEAAFMDVNQKLYNAGSEATMFMVKPNDSVRVAAFAAAAGRTRDIEDQKKIVMAVDILPSEIPRESSVDFSRVLKPLLAELSRADLGRPSASGSSKSRA